MLPGDWAPELLYAMISSRNEDARDALYSAAFAAGQAIVPQLEAALKDDRTAEFAAQVLAYIGGPKAFEVLTKLVNDPRDLDLRRFYYGTLGEFQAREATSLLFNAIDRADSEPDRTVTGAAILAVTVHSDAGLASALRQAGTRIHDPVIRDDLENAAAVVENRARYLASPEGRNIAGSLQEAVRTYFMPALQPGAVGLPDSAGTFRSVSTRPATGKQSGEDSFARKSARPATTKTQGAVASEPPPPSVKVEIRNLTFSPEKTRALARVSFEDSSAVAYYDMILQKRDGNWTLASVWLGSESEKVAVTAKKVRSAERRRAHK